MIPPAEAEATAGAACSACGGKLDVLGKCASCGAVFGEAYRCPFCHAVSEVEPSAELTWVCRTCGGPRVPAAAGASPEAEVALFRAARREQLRSGAFRAGAGFALGAGLLALLVTSVVLFAISPPPLAQGFALLASVVPLVLGATAFARARRHAREMAQALQQAWLSATARVIARDGQLTAAELAAELRIDETRAELLLAEVAVQDLVGASDPRLKLRVTGAAAAGEPLVPAEPDETSVAAEQERGAATRASKP